jgi:hypothetical protein
MPTPDDARSTGRKARSRLSMHEALFIALLGVALALGVLLFRFWLIPSLFH